MIHSFLEDTFVPKVFFLLPFLPCFIVIYTIIGEERERERENKIYRVSVRNCKIRDVIFMSFLPRLRVIKLRIFLDKVRLTGS